MNVSALQGRKEGAVEKAVDDRKVWAKVKLEAIPVLWVTVRARAKARAMPMEAIPVILVRAKAKPKAMPMEAIPVILGVRARAKPKAMPMGAGPTIILGATPRSHLAARRSRLAVGSGSPTAAAAGEPGAGGERKLPEIRFHG